VKVKETDLAILADLCVFSAPEYEDEVFGWWPVCLHVMSSLIPERLQEFYSYSVFRNL
jgi:hypothetical protein